MLSGSVDFVRLKVVSQDCEIFLIDFHYKPWDCEIVLDQLCQRLAASAAAVPAAIHICCLFLLLAVLKEVRECALWVDRPVNTARQSIDNSFPWVFCCYGCILLCWKTSKAMSRVNMQMAMLRFLAVS